MADVVSHYDASAPTYTGQYDEAKLLTSPDYLASFFRLKKVKQRALDLGLTSIYELGIGDGSPLLAMAEAGLCHLLQRRMDTECFAYILVVRPRSTNSRGMASAALLQKLQRGIA